MLGLGRTHPVENDDVIRVSSVFRGLLPGDESELAGLALVTGVHHVFHADMVPELLPLDADIHLAEQACNLLDILTVPASVHRIGDHLAPSSVEFECWMGLAMYGKTAM